MKKLFGWNYQNCAWEMNETFHKGSLWAIMK